jgi:predicted Fe-Mo cluster-binding NifX family protein
MTNKEIGALREQCSAYIKQMTHCRQCRSDAAGTLDADISLELRDPAPPLAAPQKYAIRRFAVATKSGAVVDLHFGHAEEFYIYESDGSESRFIETRKVAKYCNGPECDGKEDRWEMVLQALSDCAGVLALRIGLVPEKRLQESGISAITTYERVETAVKQAAERIEVNCVESKWSRHCERRMSR